MDSSFQEVFDQLRSGNEAYSRSFIEVKSSPKATIFTCSDPRIEPEKILSADQGSLFVIRNAGNVLDEVAISSIYYGVFVFQTPLLVILGHKNCRAVENAQVSNEFHLEAIHTKITTESSKQNTLNQLAILAKALPLEDRLAKGNFLIKLGNYCEQTGRVDWFGHIDSARSLQNP